MASESAEPLRKPLTARQRRQTSSLRKQRARSKPFGLRFRARRSMPIPDTSTPHEDEARVPQGKTGDSTSDQKYFVIRQSQVDAAQLEITLREQLDEPVPPEVRMLADAEAGQRIRIG